MFERSIVLVSCLALAASGCKSSPAAVETSSVREAPSSEAPVDSCSVKASRERLKATFERSAGCAADALTAGLAEKIKLFG